MDPQPPQKLKNAAIIQLVAGALDLLFGWGVAWFVLGCIGSTISSPCMCIGLPPIGGFCGFLGFLILPLSFLELGAGIYGMTNPKAAGPIMRIASYVQMAGLLCGGLFSAIGGVVAYLQMNDPEVAAYIASTTTP